MKISLLTAWLLLATTSIAQNYSKVKVYIDSEGVRHLSELGVAMDHGFVKENVFRIVTLSDTDLQILNDEQVSYEVLISDVKAHYLKQNLNQETSAEEKNVTCTTSGATYNPATPSSFYMNASYGGFYTYQDMLDALDAMVAAYPNLITVKAPIGTFLTHENRPVYYVKISDNPATNDLAEPNILYTSLHHAREPLSLSQQMYYMWYLLENYASNEEVQHLVNNTELYFVPCVNPDGYIHNEVNDPSGGGMHRKNKRAVGTSNPGVDPNRNYSYQWNTTGVSSDPNNDTYPGPSAFSEPETQAIKWLTEQYGFVSAFNTHTYGNLMLFPIGSTSSEFADHHSYFEAVGAHMTIYNNYVSQKSSALYPASGDSDDYLYKVDIGVGLKDTVFAYTPEIGTDFWPASSTIIPSCQDMLFPNMVLAHIAHKYLAVTETDPALISSISGNLNHEVRRYGLESGSVTVSIDPLLNVLSTGTPLVYDLNILESAAGAISYTLDPGIQFGDQIKYILKTDYGTWAKRDTIVKTFGLITPQFVEDATASTNWTGSWGLTTATFVSPSSSFTDSPSGDYANNTNKTYTYNQLIDLTNATAAQVSFYAKWDIEADYDYAQLQVSANGATWVGQCGQYTVAGSNAPWSGSVQPDGDPVWEGVSDWILEEISLSDYLGQQVQLRFVIKSDNGATRDGFYFDDFTVSYNLDDSGLAEEKLAALKLMPNPAGSSVNVILPIGMSSGQLILRDQTGRIQLSVNVPAGNLSQVIDLSKLAAGVYYVTFNDGEKETASEKLIKLN